LARRGASVAWHLVQYYTDIFSSMLLNAFVRRGINIIIFTLYILLRIAVKSLIWMWVNVHVTVINRKLLRARSRFENRPHRRPRLTEWENAVLTLGKRRRRLALARTPRYYYKVFIGDGGWASKAARVCGCGGGAVYSPLYSVIPLDDEGSSSSTLLGGL